MSDEERQSERTITGLEMRGSRFNYEQDLTQGLRLRFVRYPLVNQKNAEIAVGATRG